MVYGIYQSAAGLQVNQYRQDVLANNLANLNTVGFKRDLATVRERQVATAEDIADPTLSDRTLDRMTGGSFVAPTRTSFDQGAIETTGGDLDVAIEGDGFFAVEDGDEVRYTRDGRFTINDRGELVTVAGSHRVLGSEGDVIRVPGEAAGEVRIEASGEVRAGEVSFGRIGVVGFDDPNGLVKMGQNLFKAVTAEPAPHAAHLRAGALEMSTVEGTRAMVAMIEVARAYEINAQMIGLADATLGRAVNDIARIR